MQRFKGEWAEGMDGRSEVIANVNMFANTLYEEGELTISRAVGSGIDAVIAGALVRSDGNNTLVVMDLSYVIAELTKARDNIEKELP